MKKIKLVLYKKSDKTIIFTKKDINTLISIDFEGSNPIPKVQEELAKLNITVDDTDIQYIGSVLNSYVLAINLPAEFDTENLHAAELFTYLDDSALVNLEDHSALSLFVIKGLSTKITKEDETR